MAADNSLQTQFYWFIGKEIKIIRISQNGTVIIQSKYIFNISTTMNSQKNDYLLSVKHSPHWIYADSWSWNTGRGQNENKEFENCHIQYTWFKLSTLSNIYRIIIKSGYFLHWTRWLNLFIFITNCNTFSMNTTPIPTVITGFTMYLLYVVYLL